MSHKTEQLKSNPSAFKGADIYTKKSTLSTKKKSFNDEWLRPMVLIGLMTMWIILSLNNNNLFLKEALLSSAIILSLSFFRGAGQYNNPEKNN